MAIAAEPDTATAVGVVAALCSPETHAEALEKVAIAALARDDDYAAFCLADRRCRISPVAEARHFTLRAETFHRRGFMSAALADLAKALRLAPDDLAANRRMLRWGADEDRQAAANRLIRLDHDVTELAEALSALKSEDAAGFGTIRRIGAKITGWATWRGSNSLDLLLESGDTTHNYIIEGNPRHPLADGTGCAADFDLPLSGGDTRCAVRLRHNGTEIARADFPGMQSVLPSAPASIPAASAILTNVTVIVPIYDDVDATTRCLESLISAIENDELVNVILVDDASPDDRMAGLLVRIARHPQVELIRNPHNLGFIGAVNAALKTVPDGDVLLLNADTVVPRGFVARLKAAAHSAADIGTATPFSNNGEATSLPKPFVSNPLPAPERVSQIDAVAAEVNAGCVVDMPDGIGYCLYIKRACLSVVRGLSDHYHRGYLEDVDLCLRAKENGFRNVCVPSVYIGHAGSASFKTQKRALVVLNLGRLRDRFPDYETEGRTFHTLDPLRKYRSAIERRLAGESTGMEILVTCSGSPASVATQFARDNAKSSIIATVSQNPSGLNLSLRNVDGDFPQSLSFVLPGDSLELTKIVEALAPSRIIVADPARVPSDLVSQLAHHGAAIDVLVSDGGLWCGRGGAGIDGQPCLAAAAGDRCACSDTAPSRYLSLLAEDGRIIAPDPFAEVLLKKRLPAHLQRQVTSSNKLIQRPPMIVEHGDAIGLLSASQSAADFALTDYIIRCIGRARPEARIVILGTTLNDLSLMALGNVSVTGMVSAEEIAELSLHYGIGRLVIARCAPLFGHAWITAAFNTVDVPIAFIDWSFGEVRLDDCDLAIPPAYDHPAIGDALVSWSAPLW